LNRDIKGYKNAREFKAFLDCGLSTFKNMD